MDRRTMLRTAIAAPLALASSEGGVAAAESPLVAMGRLMGASPFNDSLLDLINAYRNALTDFNANAPSDDEGANAYADISYSPYLEQLSRWDSAAPTRESAIEALRIALADDGGCYGCEAADRMVDAALRYLENV